MLLLQITSIFLAIAATCGRIQNTMFQSTTEENKGNFLVYLGEWSNCETHKEIEDEKLIGELRRAKSQSLFHLPQLGIQRRVLQCRDSAGRSVDKSNCARQIDGIATAKLCVLKVDCQLSSWSEWHTDPNTGESYRTRNVDTLPQGDGEPCGRLEERKALHINEEPHWLTGNWGPCIVYGDKAGVVEEAIWSAWGVGVSTGECGGGEQRRSITCAGRAGRPLPDSACANLTLPVIRQPCEVSCPRECKMGPWSEWSPCQPIGECPMFPVQEITSVGYSIRTRRALESDLDTGIMCGPTGEVRSCAVPRCAMWKPTRWDFCELNERHKKCGSGTRQREFYCVDHKGDQAPKEWCSWSGGGPHLPRIDTCRIACPGDCVISRWGNWSECSASCASPHSPPPKRTRRRYIIGHAAQDGWPCPTPEQLIQTETCNNHACNSYSWMTLPWGSCKRIEKEKKTRKGHFRASSECPENGIQKREVWCLQNNDKIVEAALCEPLKKPIAEQSCKIECPLSCKLGAWSEWSPCPNTCESATQVRVRKVEGGEFCEAPMERRVCPLPRDCLLTPDKNDYTRWQADKWQQCVILPGNENGLQVRGFWCASGKQRVDASVCVGKLAPVSVRPCDLKPLSPTPERCRLVCNDPYTPEDDNRDGCLCDGFSLQVLPASECILSKSGRSGKGRKLRAVVCRGPDDEFLHVDVCRRNIKLKSLEKLNGYKWDKEFPDLVSTSCIVPKPADCRLGLWSEWGLCNLDGFRYRNRTILREPQAGGRTCGTTVQRLSCKIDFAIWDVSDWGPCVSLQPPCGYAFTNRTVRCISSLTADVIDESHCSGKKPSNSMRCRAPCPHDCAMSPWSEWSVCKISEGQGRRDRTRAILRPAAPGGTACGQTIQSQPCVFPSDEQPEYSWTFSEWDDCQPLGGSPCGEGTKNRTIRCQNDIGEYVEDLYCKDKLPEGELRDWCYISCTADCEMTAWSAWDLSKCACGLEDTYAYRNRTILVEPAGEGRKCGATFQTIPCPILPCSESDIALQTDRSKCFVMITDKYVEGATSVCGHGVQPICGGFANNHIGIHEQWRCHTIGPKELYVPPNEPKENECLISCECTNGSTGPWSDWGLCINGVRSRSRTTTPCDAHSKYEIIEYMNCTDVDEMDSYEDDDLNGPLDNMESMSADSNKGWEKTTDSDAPHIDFLPTPDSVLSYNNIRFALIITCFIFGSAVIFIILTCMFPARSDVPQGWEAIKNI